MVCVIVGIKKSNFASKVVAQKFWFCVKFWGARKYSHCKIICIFVFLLDRSRGFARSIFLLEKAGLCRKNHDTYADFCDILSVFSWKNDIFYCK